MSYNFAILNGIPCTGNWALRKVLLSYDNTLDIYRTDFRPDKIKKQQLDTLPENMIGVSWIQHWGLDWWDFDLKYTEKESIVEKSLREYGYTSKFFCGIRHPMLIIFTLLKKEIIDYWDLIVTDQKSPMTDDEIISDVKQNEKTIMYMKMIDYYFNHRLDMNVTAIPIDTLSGMDEENRLKYITDRIDLVEGDNFRRHIKAWNSYNTIRSGNFDYSPDRKKRMAEILPRVRDDLMNKDSMIGSKLHSFFETEAFRKWYPMGMDLDTTNTKVFGCGDMLK